MQTKRVLTLVTEDTGPAPLVPSSVPPPTPVPTVDPPAPFWSFGDADPARDPAEKKDWRVKPGERGRNPEAFAEMKRLLERPFEPKTNTPTDLNSATLMTPRDYQPWVFEEVEKALANPDIKYVIVDSPTGTGKSVIGTAIARATGYGLVSAPTKYLQDQIDRDFGDKLVTIKGQSNYLCHQAMGRVTVEECDGEDCGACVHNRLLTKSSEARVVSVNTSLLLARVRNEQDPARLAQRRIPVLDEAHRLESDIIGAAEIVLTRQNLREKKVLKVRDKIPDYQELGPYLLWLVNEIDPVLVSFLDNAGSISKKNRSEFKLLRNSIAMLAETVDKFGPEVAHFEKTLDPDTGEVVGLRISPVNVSVFAQKMLFNRYDKFVLLSATFLDLNYFMENLGIDKNRAYVIKVPSLFPRENRPIYTHLSVGRINYSNIQKLTPDILKRITSILQHHSEDKGIIFVPSYQLAATIFNGLDPQEKSRVIYPTSAARQQAALEEHRLSPRSTILLSPSMAEGVDLKDDLSRLQILVRVPWASLSDQLVVRRKELYPKSYVYSAILNIVQSLGRSIRNKGDKARTYVLDSGFLALVESHPEFFPDWVKEAIVDPRSNQWLFPATVG